MKIIRNANIVTADEQFVGSLSIAGTLFADVAAGVLRADHICTPVAE